MGDGCSDATGFDFVGAVSAYSALTGVAAGVLFTGIVFLVGFQSSDDIERSRRSAIELMTPTVFLMLIASFLFAAIGGETICDRGILANMCAGALLGVGGVATFQAIAWMLSSVGTGHQRLHDIASATQSVLAVIVLFQLSLTAADVVGAFDKPPLPDAVIQIYSGIGGALILITTIGWWRGQLGWLQRNVEPWWMAWMVLLQVLVSAVGYNLTVRRDENLWTGDAPWFTAALVLAVLVFSLLATIVSLVSSPPRQPVKSRSGAIDPRAPDGRPASEGSA